MATHKSAPNITIKSYEKALAITPKYGFHFTNDDVQYLLDVIKEKDMKIGFLKMGNPNQYPES